MELLPVSIGVGLVVSLLFTELLGFAAGGMVVPGYFALFLDKPIDVALTLLVGLATFAIVRALAGFAIVYGRRRTVLMILVAYILGALVRLLNVPGMEKFFLADGYNVIGFIIPGLIAIWFDRQGILETLSTLLTASVVVRLVLIIFLGQEL